VDNPRAEKVAVVDEVRRQFVDAQATIFTEYRGLKVKDLAGLRRTLRASGGEYKIYKNTLVRLAAKDTGLEGVDDLLVGPTGIAFVSGDAAAVAKVLRDFARTNPLLVIKGGLLGDKVIDQKETTALAELPPREVLLAQIAGALAAPMQQFAGLLQALPRNLAYGLAALRDQRAEEAPVETAAPETAIAETAATETAATETAATETAAAAAEEPATVEEPAAGETAEAPEAEASAEPAAETTEATPTSEAAADAETDAAAESTPSTE
jgi:large subunit ribosomal protein L10